MSGLTMERNHDERNTGLPDAAVVVGHHAEEGSDHDAVAPLRPVRPHSSRGLLRKDTPAVLDTSKVDKAFKRAEVHHSPQVAEEDEEDDIESKDSDTNIVDKTTTDVTLTNAVTNTSSTTVTTTLTSLSSTATVEKTSENDATTKELNADAKSCRTTVGITVECSDGTRPKCKPSNGGARMSVNDSHQIDDQLKSAVAKAKRQAVTFKEKHVEGFHAHTKSGTKVLMRKETPASLPSMQKVKVKQRFHQPSEKLTEIECAEDEETIEGACGEG